MDSTRISGKLAMVIASIEAGFLKKSIKVCIFLQLRRLSTPRSFVKLWHLACVSSCNKKGVQFPEANMTSQTNMTARNLRQFGKRQLPPLLSEYWLVADESSAQHFQDFKHINRVPPISENGGDWKGVCGNETSEWYKKIEESYASKPGTLVLKPKEGKKDINWCGVFRSPSGGGFSNRPSLRCSSPCS